MQGGKGEMGKRGKLRIIEAVLEPPLQMNRYKEDI
jgi:hypothetical protein